MIMTVKIAINGLNKSRRAKDEFDLVDSSGCYIYDFIYCVAACVNS